MFIITKDHLDPEAENNAVGVIGPRNVTHGQIKTLKAIAQGKRPKGVEAVHFHMYDDDGERYYSGYYVETDGDEFEPLDCFGTPNAGCTRIDIRCKDGKYHTV